MTSLKPTPLFSVYGFARLDPEEIHTTTIKATRGVSQIVRFGERPAVMSDRQMNAMKEMTGRLWKQRKNLRLTATRSCWSP